MRAKILLSLTLLLATLPAIAEEGAADARRHMLRGIAAIEIATNNTELQLAAEEFQRATDLDPALSAAWYNLGSVQTKMGLFDSAIQSYKRYLALVPQAEDAQKVQDEIVKLEFRQEQVAKSKGRAGYWIASDGTQYQLKVEGNHLTLVTERHPISDNEAESTYTIVGKMPITERERVEYRLVLTGNRLAGTWMHSSVKTEKCTLPEESGDVTGELNDRDGTIVLHHARTKYRASTQLSVLTNDYCSGVEAVEKREVAMTFHGPVPKGSPREFSYTGLQQSIEGFLKIGWFGHIKVATVAQNSPAYEAGLRADDDILAIDGNEVKSLSAGDVIWRMQGEVGTEVNLTVLHKGEKEPVSLKIKRTDVPVQPGQ